MTTRGVIALRALTVLGISKKTSKATYRVSSRVFVRYLRNDFAKASVLPWLHEHSVLALQYAAVLSFAVK